MLSGWLLKLTEHFITFKEMFNKLINHLYFQMMGQGLAQTTCYLPLMPGGKLAAPDRRLAERSMALFGANEQLFLCTTQNINYRLWQHLINN